MKIAIYPGSFDPVTNGHLDIIERSAQIFDRVVVAILVNSNKVPAFSTEEKKEMLLRVTAHLPNVEIDFFDGLLVSFVKSKGAQMIVKGLRAISDFEYEFQMALSNKNIAPEIETLFMMTNSKYSYLSSSIVRELATLGASLEGLVPPEIIEDIVNKLNQDR